MSRDTLIEAIKDLLAEWQDEHERIAEFDSGDAAILQECIDGLKGILPPEE